MKNLLIFYFLFLIGFFFLPIQNPYVRYSFIPKMISKEQIRTKLNTIPKKYIKKMIQAGQTLLHQQSALMEKKHLIYEPLLQEKPFVNWKHYPKNDVIDIQNQSQYYYHKHRPNESGHFHIFYRLNSVNDKNSLYIPKKKKTFFIHFIAISLDEKGNPAELFTTNQWVTNEVWMTAEQIQKYLDSFQIKINQPSAEINEWINTLIYFYKIPILVLLEERDKKMKEPFHKFDRISALRDHSIEIITQLPLTLQEHLDLLQQSLSSY